MLTFNGIWHFEDVFSSHMNPGFHCTGQMAVTVWRRMGERFADVNVVDRVAHDGGWVMVWAGVCYGQWTQVHFIDGIFNAQRYVTRSWRTIVVPFIHEHHLMLQHDNARPHVARICTQFLEAENIPVLEWPAYSPDMSPIEHVWDALDRRIWQRVPVPANIQQLCTAIEEEWTNIPQATINNLINSMRRSWQVVVTPDTDWFSDPPPRTSLRHTCAIIMLSNQHLDTPHLWMDYLGKGEVLTNTDLDRFVNNIWEK